jgi:hypothetical protein
MSKYVLRFAQGSHRGADIDAQVQQRRASTQDSILAGLIAAQASLSAESRLTDFVVFHTVDTMRLS